MRTTSEERSVNEAVTKLQRLAVRAAVIGFSMSLGMVILYSATQHFAANNTGIRSALEALCVLLWPSAVLMLGARTYHGGAVLFLLSACLNAGYFVLATMVFVTVIQKFNFAASTSKASPLTVRLPDRPLSKRLRRAEPLA